MHLHDEINNILSAEFGTQFAVRIEQQTGAKLCYDITPPGSKGEYFRVHVEERGSVRLILNCEPDIYGARFLELISNTTIERRKRFCELWSILERLGRFVVLVNNIPVNKVEFVNLGKSWKSFSFRFTKAPFYDEDEEQSRIGVLRECIVVFFALILSLVEYEIEEPQSQEGPKIAEGQASKVLATRYERSPINRQLCLQLKGYRCSVCGFDFEETYGVIGREFIHVHHAIPVSRMEEGHIVVPAEELFPVCPNCHSMLHRKDPPYSIEELRRLVSANR